MDTLLHRFEGKIKGVISGFDRIVFKGIFRPIAHAAGMQYCLLLQNVLNKDFKDYMIAQSQSIVQSAEELSKNQCNCGIIYLPSTKTRKEALAHERQKESGAEEGLIGVWSCVESCNTFRSTYDPVKKYPVLRAVQSKCKHLYYYFDDPVLGFMSVRLQTWAPYEIQIALNGREWLRRTLDAVGCGYVLGGNKFLHIDDYELAQKLLDAQLEVDFKKILNGFLPTVFPAMPQAASNMSYYWTLWQSEVAKDYVFQDNTALALLMKDFQRHALITGIGERVLHYFGSPVRADGQPRLKTKPEIISRTNNWYDGLRVRHWNGANSVKLYNEHNVLRLEMTMNDPTKFKIYRHSENQDRSEPKKFMPMRKGIADINARAGISLNIVNRFAEHMSTLEETVPLGELLKPIAKPVIVENKRHRAIDAFGKDMELLKAISDPIFNVGSITNKELQKKLAGNPWAKNMTEKQLSGRISRHLALLRAHGLIKKLTKQRKYALTDKGYRITSSLNAALSASVNDLLSFAA